MSMFPVIDKNIGNSIRGYMSSNNFLVKRVAKEIYPELGFKTPRSALNYISAIKMETLLVQQER